MPLRLWPSRSKKRKPLETRLRRLEKSTKHFATTLDVCNFWNEMASAHGLTRRLKALETRQEDTDAVLLRLMRDVTVVEGKVNGIVPGDDDSDDDDNAERSSVAGTSSLEVSSENNVGPMLALGETPVTFTRRKSNSAERVTLDGSGLRLPEPARSPRHDRADRLFEGQYEWGPCDAWHLRSLGLQHRSTETAEGEN